ncbi:aminotransferase class IV [Propionibacteriaceae bacterium Y2011]|uniref:aminotransferase class IV n=1 Tax=Microlunatus sp. Y2014 TaxID=3418488 RepID=UPI003B4E4584
MPDTSPAARPSLTVWVNGQLLSDPTQPALSPVDHGLVVGDGVFEATKITEDGAFAVQRHLDRLSTSAAKMGLPEPDHDQIRAAIDAVLADRSYDRGKLRVTWTGGNGPLGTPAAFGPPTLVVAAEAAPKPDAPEELYTVPWTRNLDGAMTGVKTTSYGDNVRALGLAHQHGAGEAIFANTAGNLSEGTGSNVFCVFGDEIVTPPLSAGILDGITRRLVLEWVSGILVRDLTVEEAHTAHEVFVTSSTRDVHPVSTWDTKTYVAPGPVTTNVMRVFAERSAADLDP